MPKVFISYARDGGSGEALAAEVQTQLQQQNFEVFRDVIGLKPGDVWYHKLEFELESSDFVVLVVSEKVRTSKWVHNEISMAEEVGIPVIPVLAEAVRSPLWLRHLQQLDFCGGREWGRLFDVLEIPPVPPFSKGGTLQPDNHETDRMASPFAKGGTRGILTPAWAEISGTDQYGQYADLVVGGKAGLFRKSKSVSQRFRWIEAGTFMMGSPKNELGRGSDETQHEVTLTRGFWMADTAVTQALWQAVMDGNPSHFKGEQLPVERVSWEDCQQFITRLNQQRDGLNAMLPTEAEWEYACRAGTTTPYVFGGQVTSRQANFGGNVGKTVPVKNFQPNGWGLYQMHGNVWEWCEDYYAKYSLEDAIDPPGSASAYRVIRGGSWYGAPRNMRSAGRHGSTPDARYSHVGFRLAQAQS